MKNGVMIRRLIFIGLLLIFIIVGVFVTYIATYNKNEVTSENAFTEEELPDSTYSYIDAKSFLSLFETFEIVDETYIKPYLNDKDEVVSNESKLSLKCTNTLRNGVIFKNNNFSLKYRLGASWINYRSNITSSNTVTCGKEKTSMYLTVLDQIFPTSGPLWFTKVESPDLYILITWTQTLGSLEESHYTILTYHFDGAHFVISE